MYLCILKIYRSWVGIIRGTKVDKKPNTIWRQKYICCLSILNCAHVLSIWVVHIFSQVLSVWVVYMFSQFELCTCSLGLDMFSQLLKPREHACERTCAQLKLREYMHPQLKLSVHSSNWENTCTKLKLREKVQNSNWENMCTNTNWENMCTTQTERTCAQFKIERQRIYFLSSYLHPIEPRSCLLKNTFLLLCPESCCVYCKRYHLRRASNYWAQLLCSSFP